MTNNPTILGVKNDNKASKTLQNVNISKTSLSISKNAECLPIARCSEYFDEILVSFSSCMLMELLEQTVKKSENCS